MGTLRLKIAQKPYIAWSLGTKKAVKSESLYRALGLKNPYRKPLITPVQSFPKGRQEGALFDRSIRFIASREHDIE